MKFSFFSFLFSLSVVLFLMPITKSCRVMPCRVLCHHCSKRAQELAWRDGTGWAFLVLCFKLFVFGILEMGRV
jgi:hypothetical protein